MQLQALQGASLVGHDVIVAGNKLQRRRRGRHRPGRLRARQRRRRGQGRDPRPERRRRADAQPRRRRAPACTASTGRRAAATSGSGLTFRVTPRPAASRRTATPLMRDRVDAVSTTRHQLQPRARELGHGALQRRQGLQLDPFPRPRGRVHRKRTRHGLPARSLRSERVEQEPRGHRQQHRQRQHRRRQGRRAPSSPTCTPTRIGGSNAVGIGVTVAAVAQQFTQGNITTTDNPLDIAINGNGFFEVSNGAARSATRATASSRSTTTATSSTTSSSS